MANVRLAIPISLTIVAIILAIVVCARNDRPHEHEGATESEHAEESRSLPTPANEPSRLDRSRLAELEAKMAVLESSVRPNGNRPEPAAKQRRPRAEERAAKIEEDFRFHESLVKRNAAAAKNADARLRTAPPGTARHRMAG